MRWPEIVHVGEIEDTREAFVDRLFAAGLTPFAATPISEEEVVVRMCAGGFLEARCRRSSRRREAWFDTYGEDLRTYDDAEDRLMAAEEGRAAEKRRADAEKARADAAERELAHIKALVADKRGGGAG